MQDLPAPPLILDLAIAQLNGVDFASPRAKFETRMAISALHLVQRALALQETSDAREHERLTALLNEAGDLETLNRTLCARIRAGDLSLNTPGLAAHLRATTMEKLAIDQPSYAAYRRALEQAKR